VTDEARLEQRENGLEAVTEGWFVLNVADGPWLQNERGGAAAIFEGDEAPFEQVGYTLAVLEPGQTGGFYHREDENQENFLVLSGECLLLIEGEERHLEAWDFVHCPPGTEHIVIGAGTGPSVVLATGSRRNREAIVYPRNELALRHEAGADETTTSPRVAYASFPKWQPGRPHGVWPPA
jgi:uncharacterized cupin superfamily protein